MRASSPRTISRPLALWRDQDSPGDEAPQHHLVRALLRRRRARLHAARTLRQRRPSRLSPLAGVRIADHCTLPQSLLDLLRKRRRYTEPEARFYLVQLIGACEYMHSNSVIHRDLKLGNLMLDADMNLRVGDFGLAALVKHPGERKRCVLKSREGIEGRELTWTVVHQDDLRHAELHRARDPVRHDERTLVRG